MAKTIDDYKKDWAAANAAGDTKAMEAAHAGAEALRAAAGYSGGADGSQYIPLSATTGATTTVTTPAPTMPSGFSGSATGVGVNSNSQASIVQQMNENSKKWYTATPEEREALHAENERLAAQLGGSVSYNSSTGTWSGAAGTAVDNVGSYNSPYSTQIDFLLNSILNRQPFSYDYTTDPSYLAYEDKYKRLGDRAREDTLGNVAALNGGYASSWATSAASQAQNDYNQQLSDIIPTLYDAAYNRYLTEDSLDRSDLNLLMSMDDMSYGRYRDTVGDAQWQTSFDRGVYESDRNYDRSVYESDRSFDWQVYTDKWNMSNTEAQQKLDKLLTKWQISGVADEEVAAELGVPVGSTTESYYFNKLNNELQTNKFNHDVSMDEWTVNNTESQQKLEKMLTKWQLTGVADEEVAAELGVPVGTTTESYYFNKLSHDLAVSKAARSGSGGGSSGDHDTMMGLAEYEAKRILASVEDGGDIPSYEYKSQLAEANRNAAASILANASSYGLSYDDYIEICGNIGISADTANGYYVDYKDEMVAQELNDQMNGEQSYDDLYSYYVAQMGAAGDEDAQEKWLETNKYKLPRGMYEELQALLN